MNYLFLWATNSDFMNKVFATFCGPGASKQIVGHKKKTLEIPMPSLNAKIGRDDLLRTISNILLKWPELERRVFSQAHYYGQTPEAISRSFQLDEKRVRTILQQCESRLHAALRDFRQHAA
jgi:DNA-directed RNA polymerase specialized sigma24 family protein